LTPNEKSAQLKFSVNEKKKERKKDPIQLKILVQQYQNQQQEQEQKIAKNRAPSQNGVYPAQIQNVAYPVYESYPTYSYGSTYYATQHGYQYP